MPIRWRLTLWFGVVLITTLLLFGGGLYLGLRWRLSRTFDDQLQTQAQLTASTIQSGGDLAAASTDSVNTRGTEQFVRLLDRNGTVLADTGSAIGGVPPNARAVAAALAGKTTLTTVAVEQETLRVVTLPLRQGTMVTGVLQVGLFRDDLDQTLAEILAAMALTAPLALAIAGAGGYLLARKALQPVTAITDVAASIGGEDLHRRLGLTLPNDEMGRLARTFDAMLARIEDAFERQRRFTGDAAHELRTPLALVRGQVDLALARPRRPEEYRAALQDIDADVSRLVSLVGTLLTLARADTDRLLVEQAPIDLAETVGTVLEQYAPVAAAAGVTLIDETSPAALVGDEDLLLQVLVNLLDNALRHTPAGGQVRLGCARVGPNVTLWVADTGCGIAPEHQHRVFDRFYRVDVGRARDDGGAGLGLAICRTIAEAHGGTIALNSRPGTGTRVELTLPSAGPPAIMPSGRAFAR